MNLKQPELAKLLTIAAAIVTEYGSMMGDRTCQDFPPEIVKVVDLLDPDEKRWLNYQYEQYNSRGRDYDPIDDWSQDAMMTSFAIGYILKQFVTSQPPFALEVGTRNLGTIEVTALEIDPDYLGKVPHSSATLRMDERGRDRLLVALLAGEESIDVYDGDGEGYSLNLEIEYGS